MTAASDDLLIARAVSRAIAADLASAQRARIRVVARAGVVTLEGSVCSRVDAARAAAAALRTEGVREVCECLRVGAGGAGDDRGESETGAYRRSGTWVRASVRGRTDSDILDEIQVRIRGCAALEATRLLLTVDAGRVTMNGEVGSPEQRLLARRLVWVAGVRIVIDSVTVRARSGDRFAAT